MRIGAIALDERADSKPHRRAHTRTFRYLLSEVRPIISTAFKPRSWPVVVSLACFRPSSSHHVLTFSPIGIPYNAPTVSLKPLHFQNSSLLASGYSPMSETVTQESDSRVKQINPADLHV